LLDGESGTESYHKDDLSVLMTVTWINIVCGASVKQCHIYNYLLCILVIKCLYFEIFTI